MALPTSPPIRVLLVDDAPDLRLLVRDILTADGSFEVIGEAANGVEALEVAGHCAPDLVLLDLAMPRLDGIQLLPLLLRTAPDAKVIVLSGLPRENMQPTTEARGAIGYIQKGGSARTLVKEVRAIAGMLEAVESAIAETRAALPNTPRSARDARQTVVAALRRWGCGQHLDAAALMVSELVTNAVVHADQEVKVAVRMLTDRIRIEVGDEGSGDLDVRRDTLPMDESGRGLQLVETLSMVWGVQDEPAGGPGKVVWFELPRTDELKVR